jgi:hypothetical protein
MHWLLRDAGTPIVLENAGYSYDSTVGFIETVGYRAGTTQVFRPIGAQARLELPMHIQDGALFYPQRLNLSDSDAHTRCAELIATTERFGGVLTVLWHDRSHGPERFWGDFYIRLLDTLRSSSAWFATASQAVIWFRTRREVRFECSETSGDGPLRLRYNGDDIHPPLKVRVHQAPSKHVDICWDGKSAITVQPSIPRRAAEILS